jgi:hypothetical protein
MNQWGCVRRQGTLAGLKALVHRVNSIGISGVATKDLESVKKLERKGAKVYCVLGASVTKLTKANLNSR